MEKLIAKSFTFEAAHKLENASKLENKNIHICHLKTFQ